MLVVVNVMLQTLSGGLIMADIKTIFSAIDHLDTYQRVIDLVF